MKNTGSNCRNTEENFLSDPKSQALVLYGWGNSATRNGTIQDYYEQLEISMGVDIFTVRQSSQCICPTVLVTRGVSSLKSINSFEEMDNFSVQIHNCKRQVKLLTNSDLDSNFFLDSENYHALHSL